MGPGAAEEGVPRPRVQERAEPVVREAAAAGVGLAPLQGVPVPEEQVV